MRTDFPEKPYGLLLGCEPLTSLTQHATKTAISVDDQHADLAKISALIKGLWTGSLILLFGEGSIPELLSDIIHNQIKR